MGLDHVSGSLSKLVIQDVPSIYVLLSTALRGRQTRTTVQVLILFLRRCAVITEFARDFLTKTAVKLVVPGEKEELPEAAASEEEELPAAAASEEGAQVEVKNGAKTVTVGEKYEVRSVSFELLLFLP